MISGSKEGRNKGASVSFRIGGKIWNFLGQLGQTLLCGLFTTATQILCGSPEGLLVDSVDPITNLIPVERVIMLYSSVCMSFKSESNVHKAQSAHRQLAPNSGQPSPTPLFITIKYRTSCCRILTTEVTTSRSTIAQLPICLDPPFTLHPPGSSVTEGAVLVDLLDSFTSSSNCLHGGTNAFH
jgi:hypothetical protein